MAANLTYYIFEGLLVGTANERFVHIAALSGGGGGSTRNRTDGKANNPYETGFKTRGSGKLHQHGGPIPVGRYTIQSPAKHPHLGLSCRLDPSAHNSMMGRGGFYIHGRGPHGSDGCIVPLHQFKQLMDDLKKDKGGALFVLEATGGARFA